MNEKKRSVTADSLDKLPPHKKQNSVVLSDKCLEQNKHSFIDGQ